MPTGTESKSHCGKNQGMWPPHLPLQCWICEGAGASFSVTHSIHFGLVTLCWVPNIGDPQNSTIDAAVFAKTRFGNTKGHLGILGTACFTFPYLPYQTPFQGCLARTLGLSHLRLLQLVAMLLVGAEGRHASKNPTNPNTMGTHNLHF